MRIPRVSLLAGLSVIAVTAIGLSGTPAYAATGLVDGSISLSSATCSWTNATTSDVPPNTLTVDHTTVSSTCSSGSASLTNDPTITFDDSAGTASSPEVDVSGTVIGVSCSYSVANVTLTRSGSTRTYSGGPFTATKTGGGGLCPSTETVSSASLTFH
jgi:hypothetical protein